MSRPVRQDTGHVSKCNAGKFKTDCGSRAKERAGAFRSVSIANGMLCPGFARYSSINPFVSVVVVSDAEKFRPERLHVEKGLSFGLW
jgi:hypothetical protein